eukprot:492197-Pyramimonas_sp.AAC.1
MRLSAPTGKTSAASGSSPRAGRRAIRQLLRLVTLDLLTCPFWKSRRDRNRAASVPGELGFGAH